MRLMITGSRTWDDPQAIERALSWWLSSAGTGNHVLVSGACAKGADRMAEQAWGQWAAEAAKVPDPSYTLTIERHPADWQLHGRGAGAIRNRQMVQSGIDYALAFWMDGSPGTRHALSEIVRARVPYTLFARWT